MRNDAEKIITAALAASDPYKNTFDALKDGSYGGNITLIAAGKAACTMASAAYDVLGKKIRKGYVLTKYGHGKELNEVFEIYEAGHPLPDENSLRYTEMIFDEAKKLSEDDRIIFLLSGGASALFESPAIPLDALIKVTDSLLRCGAEISEINTVRKKLSFVKGGKFAIGCKCRIDCLILSDVLGDKVEMIASGPCCDDNTTAEDAMKIIDKYHLDFSDDIINILKNSEKTKVRNAENRIIGSLPMLCDGAKKCAEALGYDARIITYSLTGEAREAGSMIAENAAEFVSAPHRKTVFIYGGETTVTVRGNGKGGRNQELALSAAVALKDTENILIFSLGSDGTDGPTDAAGGIVDGSSYQKMKDSGIVPEDHLADNNAYAALSAIDSLIITGPTGTNVNDIACAIIF